MDKRLRSVLLKINAHVIRMDAQCETIVLGDSCHDLAVYLEPLFKENWKPAERLEIDRLFRDLLFLCYEVRTLTNLSYLKYIKPEDVQARVRTLQKRLYKIKEEKRKITATLFRDALWVCASINKVCNVFLFSKDSPPPPEVTQDRVRLISSG